MKACFSLSSGWWRWLAALHRVTQGSNFLQSSSYCHVFRWYSCPHNGSWPTGTMSKLGKRNGGQAIPYKEVTRNCTLPCWEYSHMTTLTWRRDRKVESLAWRPCVPLKLWESHLLLTGKRDEPCFLFTSPHPILLLNISHQPGFHSSLLPAKRPPNSLCATLHGCYRLRLP